ncbi:MAG: NAD(P)-dependent oxidoreductase [Candidatus Bathyarchaeia archaeon]
MKVLVTGASGFLGGHLTEFLTAKGVEVVAMVRKTSDTSLIDRLGLEKRVADMTDPPSLCTAVKGVDAVIHLAGYYTFHGKKELYDLVTVQGTKSILDACLQEGVKRFVYCSSTEAIGAVEDVPALEDHPPNPQYEYGRSKLKAECAVREYDGKLETTIVRPSGIYGPRNIDDISYYFITSCARNSLATRMLVDHGSAVVQFVHAEDAAQGFYLALTNANSIGKTYFISEGRWYTYREVYEIISRITGRKPPTLSLPKLAAKALIYPVFIAKSAFGEWSFLWDPKTVDAVTSNRAYSVEKAKSELGYSPKYSLEAGLKETIQWYRDNGIVT